MIPIKGTYKIDNEEFVKPKFPNDKEDIKCYKLKKEKLTHWAISNLEKKHGEKRPKKVIANLSYFIDKINDKSWFEEKNITCIDLSVAKLIKGKIILNGDILTYLKLKKESAKRKLYELVNQGKITKESKFDWNKKSDDKLKPNETVELKIRAGKEEYGEIYYFENRFDEIEIQKDKKYTFENTEAYFENYLKKLIDWKYSDKKDAEITRHIGSIDKINQLRDAITSNMIGIISHLQKKYPGFIILEDLDQNLMDRHFEQFNHNVSRRMEWAFYRKMQSKGLVPPHIKDIFAIREIVKKEQYKPFEKEFEKFVNDSYQKNKAKQEYVDKTEEEAIEIIREKNEKQQKIKFRKEKNLSLQFGTLIFVDEYQTSKNCPYCEKTMRWKNKETVGDNKKNNPNEDATKNLKFKQQRFFCGGLYDINNKEYKHHTNSECQFDTEGEKYCLEDINDPDKVAAYNVAKKITKDQLAKFNNKDKK